MTLLLMSQDVQQGTLLVAGVAGLSLVGGADEDKIQKILILHIIQDHLRHPLLPSHATPPCGIPWTIARKTNGLGECLSDFDR